MKGLIIYAVLGVLVVEQKYATYHCFNYLLLINYLLVL